MPHASPSSSRAFTNLGHDFDFDYHNATHEQINTLADKVMLRGVTTAVQQVTMKNPFTPQFDVKESKDGYVFKADLPGIKEKDLDISLTGNRLTVSGRREEEQRQEEERFFAYERSYGSFSRSFTLPEGVDAENVQAELKDGVLTLNVAKKPEVKAKKIELKTIKPGEKAHA